LKYHYKLIILTHFIVFFIYFSDITTLRPVTSNTNKSELFERLEIEMHTQKGRELPGGEIVACTVKFE
jgi:hypothetical protein